MPLAFKPLYHGDLVEIVNPEGDVGLITLWSPRRAVKRKLSQIAPDALDPKRSRIAAMGNLYGDGMHAMLCNLLFNPQVCHLVAIGEDLGLPTCDELSSLIAHGLEDAEALGALMKRIVGTGRLLPATPGFDEAPLRQRLTFHRLGRLSDERLAADLRQLLRELPLTPPSAVPERIRVEGAAAEPTLGARRPSQLTAHHVERRTPLRCWEELIVRAFRFGAHRQLRKGPRIELLNARAVILQPQHDHGDALAARGFDLDDLLRYGERMLDPHLPEGIAYTYGNRLRAHFDADGPSGCSQRGGGSRDSADDSPLDALQAAIDVLSDDPESRRAYISLWDNSVDLASQDRYAGASSEGKDTQSSSAPCLATIFFRRTDDGRLSLTATFRSHNLLTGWLRNAYGLMALQRHVAEGCGMPPGHITVISHSLSIDPQSPRFQLAQRLSESWRRDDDVDQVTGKRTLRQDPNGYFVLSADRQAGEIVAEHRFDGVLIKRYSGPRASGLAAEIAGDLAVSLPSHALWLGAELARKEALLGREEAHQAPAEAPPGAGARSQAPMEAQPDA